MTPPFLSSSAARWMVSARFATFILLIIPKPCSEFRDFPGDFSVFNGKDLRGQVGGICAIINAHRGNGDPRRHLYNSVECVSAVQDSSGKRYADDWQRGVRRDCAG